MPLIASVIGCEEAGYNERRPSRLLAGAVTEDQGRRP